MPSVTLTPGTVTDGGGGNFWSSPTNAETLDGVVTSCSLAAGVTSDVLLCTNFGFSASIPSGATILGVQATITKDATYSGSTAAAVTDSIVQLVVSAGTPGSNKANTVTPWPGSLSNVIYGSSTDTWGASPLSSQVLLSSFGIQIQVTNAVVAGAGVANIDCVQLTVWWTTGTPNPPILRGGQLSQLGIRTGGRLYRHATYSFPARKPGIILPARRIFSR